MLIYTPKTFTRKKIGFNKGQIDLSTHEHKIF